MVGLFILRGKVPEEHVKPKQYKDQKKKKFYSQQPPKQLEDGKPILPKL